MHHVSDAISQAVPHAKATVSKAIDAAVAEVKTQGPQIKVFMPGGESTTAQPGAVALPNSAEDSVLFLKLAALEGVQQVCVRSGDHSFEGMSLGGKNSRALVIDMANMNQVAGGVLLAHVYEAVWNNGQQVVGMGSCGSVAVAGQMQAGGYRHYTRKLSAFTNGADAFKTREALQGWGTFTVQWPLHDFDIGKYLRQIEDAVFRADVGLRPMIVLWKSVLEVTGSVLLDPDTVVDEAFKTFVAKYPPKLSTATQTFAT
ncbi:hypothetical protein CspeluHIS016_0702010 [Cutaneotrichosporon spelunceum]|uniref:Uncharacterized protein n=1 Tax=Cutaneotrichosporon spelunceum TaxID=1672016 RepID=A0AAD3TYG0_9TREE|nr:hypothetical protein CspeluHIS016_0702010 [Cutaneotrichosporon spelunceum]